MPGLVVDIAGLRFRWPGSELVLDMEAFSLKSGESVFLRGASGSGKSTLLGLIAGILHTDMDSGCLNVLGHDMTMLSGGARDAVRADHFGVIFQMFNLIPCLSVLENVALPCRFSKRRMERVRAAGGVEAESRRLLGRLGLNTVDVLNRPVNALSIGQQQRTAVARALIGGPDLILADEPTSALDTENRDRFIQLLTEECEQTGAAMLFASHDRSLACLFERTVDIGNVNRAVLKAGEGQ